MRTHFRAFEKFLKAQALTFEKEVRNAAKESISPRGKLIRPTLVFAAANACTKNIQSLVRRAAIVELTHLSTLIHDDVIDNADIRRSNETANKKYGSRTAILLGDAIFAHTMALSVEDNNLDVARRTALCVKTICEGEISQTLSDKTKRISRKRYYDIAYGKTAVLFELACALGATAIEAPKDWVNAAAEAGKQLGIAYQIYDDLCDWFMSEKDAGKTLGTDLISGKQTFPLIALMETMTAKAADKFAKNLPAQDPKQVLEMMLSNDIEKICNAEIKRRITIAEKSISAFPKLALKLLDFCSAMRTLSV